MTALIIATAVVIIVLLGQSLMSVMIQVGHRLMVAHTKKMIVVVAVVEVGAVDKVASNKKSLFLKIAIVVAIVVVIVGIFIFKSAKNNDQTAQENTASQSQTEEDAVNYPLKITKTDLESIKAYGIPTVIDFGSDSCIPCKQMAPVLETLNKEWQGKAAVQFMDVWKYTDGVSDFPVSVIPTQVFFNADGTPYVPSEAIQKEIEFTMYSDKNTNEHIFTVHQGGITEEQMRKIFAEMGVE